MKKVVALLLVLCVLLSGCGVSESKDSENTAPIESNVEGMFYKLVNDFWGELGYGNIEIVEQSFAVSTDTFKYYKVIYPFTDSVCEFIFYSDEGVINRVEFWSVYNPLNCADIDGNYSNIDMALETLTFSLLPVAFYLELDYDSLRGSLEDLFYSTEIEQEEENDIVRSGKTGNVEYIITQSYYGTFCEVKYTPTENDYAMALKKPYSGKKNITLNNYIGQPAKEVFEDFGYNYEVTPFNDGTGFIINGIWFKFLDYLDWNAEPTNESVIIEIFTDTEGTEICYGVKIGDSLENVEEKIGIDYYDGIYDAYTYLLDFDIRWMVDPVEKNIFGATITSP